VQYRFPLAEVQSLVCIPEADIVTLRTGKVYSGRYLYRGESNAVPGW
jgi:hypothetical protein